MSARRRLSDDERAQRRAQDRDRLEQATRALLSSEGWQCWIHVRSQAGLARLSVGNQMLVAMQAPDATFVAGFRSWLKLDRVPRKGAKAIRILAPMRVRRRDGDQSGAAAEDDSEVRVLFKSVPVFDVLQCDVLPGRVPPPLTPPCEPITGDSHARLLSPLENLAAELGYSVRHLPLDGGADGWCDSERMEIVVNDQLPANAQVRVLTHELAHALGLGYADLGRQRAEVLVDCVTYCVLGSVGLDTGGESIPYIAGWGEDGELDAIRAYAQTIDEVARRIEDAIRDTDESSLPAAA